MTSEMRIIETMHLSKEFRQFNSLDTFQYNAKGKYPWLQKLCFKALRWLRASALLQEGEVRRVRLDLDDLVKAIMINQSDVEYIYHKRAKFLIVGHDKFKELAKCEEFDYHFFDIPSNYRANVGYDREPMPYLFRGLRVVVVPWIDGMFVLPDLEQ